VIEVGDSELATDTEVKKNLLMFQKPHEGSSEDHGEFDGAVLIISIVLELYN